MEADILTRGALLMDYRLRFRWIKIKSELIFEMLHKILMIILFQS